MIGSATGIVGVYEGKAWEFVSVTEQVETVGGTQVNVTTMEWTKQLNPMDGNDIQVVRVSSTLGMNT